MRFRLLPFLIFFQIFLTRQLNAQSNNDCEQTLNQAAQEFTAGHFYGLPSLLKPCLNKFSKEQNIRAYLLLTQTYLLIDDPIAAEDSYLKLLKADPEYIATPEKDPIDIVYLSKKFTTKPIFEPRVVAGANASAARTIFNINTDPIDIDTKRKIGVSYQLGGGLDWNIDSHISLGLEAVYGSRVFSSTRVGVSRFDEQKIIETQSWFDLPIYVRYTFKRGRISPYVYAGYAYNLLLSATANATYVNNKIANDGVLPIETVVGDIPMKNKRNASNRSIVIGVGGKYKLKKTYISVDLRYMMGISNLTSISNNFYDDGSTFSTSATRYRSVSDLFSLDNLSLSVGFIMPAYKPRKIKSMKSNELFHFLKKKEKTADKI